MGNHFYYYIFAFWFKVHNPPRPHISIFETAIKFATTEENTPPDLFSGQVSTHDNVWRIDWKPVIILRREHSACNNASYLGNAFVGVFPPLWQLKQKTAWSRQSSQRQMILLFGGFPVCPLFFLYRDVWHYHCPEPWPRKRINSCWQGQWCGGS